MEKDACEKIGAFIRQNNSSICAAGNTASPAPSSTSLHSSALILESTPITASPVPTSTSQLHSAQSLSCMLQSTPVTRSRRRLSRVSRPVRQTPSFRDSSATSSHSINPKASTPKRPIVVSYDSPVVTVSHNN